MKTGKGLLGIILILSALCTQSCREKIEAGYAGILIEQYGSEKGVQDVSLVTGSVWYNPWTQDVDQMPTFVQTIDFAEFTVDAKGGGTFVIDPTISIAVKQERAASIYTKYRIDLEDIIKTSVRNDTKDAYRIVFNKYSMDSVINSRAKIEAEVEKMLLEQLELEEFILSKLTHGIKYPDVIVNAINAKNKAFQEALQVETQLKKERAQAEIDLLKAKTKAETNRLQQVSITDKLLMQQFIEKWDGHTPLYGSLPTLLKSIQ